MTYTSIVNILVAAGLRRHIVDIVAATARARKRRHSRMIVLRANGIVRQERYTAESLRHLPSTATVVAVVYAQQGA